MRVLSHASKHKVEGRVVAGFGCGSTDDPWNVVRAVTVL
jgi:hypothetical protein